MKHPIVRAILILVGVVAFVLAVVFALRGADFSALAEASPWQLMGLAAGVIVNLLLTSVLFWLVTRQFDARPPVSLGRMIQLILSSSVLNYLPLRAGLFSRAAYLKAKHQLPLKQSGVILLIILALGALVLGSVGVAVIVGGQANPIWVILLTSFLLLFIGPALGAIIAKKTHLPMTRGSVFQWVLIRLLDMFVVGGRTWCAFAIAGYDITFAQATAMGAAGMLVSLLGLTPNGLGMREWALAGMTLLVSSHDASAGMTAALVDRAMEVVVVCVLGLPATVQLMRLSPRPPQVSRWDDSD